MRKGFLVTAALVLTASGVGAQMPDATQQKIEIRPFAGASVPIGSQRDLFTDEFMFGLQGALEMRPNFHVVSSFGWVPAHSKFAVTDDNVNVFQYDVGIEYGLVRPLGVEWQFKPFVGVGVGARTYAYAAEGLKDRTCAAGYGAVGTEFQLSPVALRVEARDNVFCYKAPIAGAESKTRYDVGVAVGLAYHFR